MRLVDGGLECKVQGFNYMYVIRVLCHVTSCDVIARQAGNWAKLDDDKVTLVKEEPILKLSGGGDWHIAYILLYAPRRLEKMKEEEEKMDQKVGGLSLSVLITVVPL